MSHIFSALLWILASTGADDACAELALVADGDRDSAAQCVAPPPEESSEGSESDRPKLKVTFAPRRISNGF